MMCELYREKPKLPFPPEVMISRTFFDERPSADLVLHESVGEVLGR